MGDLKQSIWEKAKSITSKFEGGEVFSNIDGQGFSMGIIQWNIGQSTLNPILSEFFNTYPQLTIDWGLSELESAINNGTALQFAIDVCNGGGKYLVYPWKDRLTSLNYSQEFQAIADNYVVEYKNQAIALCNQFGRFTDRDYCFFFDVSVQNWNIKYTPIDNSLASIIEALVLQVEPQWQSVVRARKTAIADGQGIVYGSLYQFDFNDTNAFEEEIKEVIPMPEKSWEQIEGEEALDYLYNEGLIEEPKTWKAKDLKNESTPLWLTYVLYQRLVEQNKK